MSNVSCLKSNLNELPNYLSMILRFVLGQERKTKWLMSCHVENILWLYPYFKQKRKAWEREVQQDEKLTSLNRIYW